MRRALFLALFAALSMLHAPSHAERLQSQAELDALLAPIALHPDTVLSQILVAVTYPEQVAEAARWSRVNPGMSGDAAVQAVQAEPWEPSVKALVAFPELLARIDESPQWASDLSAAVVGQQPDVIETIQDLRRRAQTSGYLRNDEHYRVDDYSNAIVVAPVVPYRLYVRHYDPWIVYGPWWWPHHRPVHWRPWRDRVVRFSGGVEPHLRWRHDAWRRSESPRAIRVVPESRRQPILQSAPFVRNAPPPQMRPQPGVRQHPPHRREMRGERRRPGPGHGSAR